MDGDDLNNFIKELPKVELHAHINGSISVSTLQKLAVKKKRKDPLYKLDLNFYIEDGKMKDLDDVFELFKVIQTLTDDADAIYLATYDIIHEFAEDNVKYLELRSTVRSNPATGMTKIQYIDAVLKAIKACQEENVDIVVRFLVALDRRDSLESLNESIDLACSYRENPDGLVVGLDLSGHPKFGDTPEICQLLVKAKHRGLRLAIHIAEMAEVASCTESLIKLLPDRIGHGTFIHHGSNDLIEVVVRENIPIEICLTSNLKCGTVKSIDEHHFRYWYQRGHPVVLCTDDKGVFSTTLSAEYLLAKKSYNLSKEDLWNLSYSSLKSIFADDSVKSRLEYIWIRAKEELISECI